jgi:hypothetical protein
MNMTESFIVQDLYIPHKKSLVKSDVKPLTCHVCKKELNGISITAKMLNNEMIFLCSQHYESKPYKIILAN